MAGVPIGRHFQRRLKPTTAPYVYDWGLGWACGAHGLWERPYRTGRAVTAARAPGGQFKLINVQSSVSVCKLFDTDAMTVVPAVKLELSYVGNCAALRSKKAQRAKLPSHITVEADELAEEVVATLKTRLTVAGAGDVESLEFSVVLLGEDTAQPKQLQRLLAQARTEAEANPKRFASASFLGENSEFHTIILPVEVDMVVQGKTLVGCLTACKSIDCILCMLRSMPHCVANARVRMDMLIVVSFLFDFSLD